MAKGKVKYFNDLRGWGIIGDANLEQDIYVHYTEIKMDGFKTLRQGQEVFFELTTSDQGPIASNVSLAG